MKSPEDPLANSNDSTSAMKEQPGEKWQETLSSLQLPHMPIQEQLNESTITICILVVADVDLSSASALAEYALQQKRYGVFDASMIDLCIACGPFCRDEDLRNYRKGKQSQSASASSQRRKSPFQRTFGNQERKCSTGTSHDDHSTRSNNKKKNDKNRACDWNRTPFFRSNEQNAALEGNMTATLSQLESIVCRLVFCPGSSDPLTTFSPAATNQAQLKFKKQQYGRLTPNSRNMNHLWIPLAPGLGCGGLCYLESVNDLLSSSRPPLTGTLTSKLIRNVVPNSIDQYEYGNDDDDDDDDDLSEVTGQQMSRRTVELLSHQVAKLGQSDKGYYPTLSRLLRLAAPSDLKTAASLTPIPLKAAQPQSILVTHYVDGLALTINDDCATDSKSSMPWPLTDHASGSSVASDREEFYESNSHLMCLEIASGSSHSNPAKWIQTPFSESRPDLNVNVLLPGSLRGRGEFSLVHVGFVETSNQDDASAKRCEWKVLNIEIHRLGEFGDK